MNYITHHNIHTINMNLLHDQGYIILKNQLRDYEIEEGLSHIHPNGDSVDYAGFKTFIDRVFFRHIRDELGWTNPTYIKFRFSNKQNAKDASTFHGDIYNHGDDDMMPIYTCLTYMDKAQMELVPYSHLSERVRRERGIPTTSSELYKSRRVVALNAGDILVFHANLHHRGLFYDVQQHRRILQVFETFPNRSEYERLNGRLYTVVSGTTGFVKSIGEMNYKLSQHKQVINAINRFHYILVCNDLQYRITMSDIPQSQKRGNFVGYEAGVRDIIRQGEYQPWNVNMMCEEDQTLSLQSSGLYLPVIVLTVAVLFYMYRHRSQ